MTGWQVGDPMTMFFNIAGETTQDDCIVVEIDNDTVSLNEVFYDEDDNECYRKFDRKTGQCLNDQTWGGGRRWIQRCWVKPDGYVDPDKPQIDIGNLFEDGDEDIQNLL